MYKQVEKPKKNGGRSVAKSFAHNKSDVKQCFGFVDNRPKVALQREIQVITNDVSVKRHGIVQREIKDVDGTTVDISPGYTSWEMDGRWHINWSLGEKDIYHVTYEDANPKIHYFFKLDRGIISDAVAPKGMKGKKGSSKKFSALPDHISSFVVQNIGELI